MTAAAMAQMGQSAHQPHGWLASMLVHMLAAAVSVFIFAELKPAPQQEPFRWDIALAQVTPPTPVETPTPVPPKPKPAVQPPPPAQPKPVETKPVEQRVQTVHTVQRVEHVVRQEQVAVQTVSPVMETIAQHAEPIQQAQPVVQQSAAVQTVEAVETTPVASVSTPALVSQPVQAEATPMVSEVTTQRPAPVVTSEPVVAQTAAPVQQAVTSKSTVEAVEAPAPVQQVALAAPAAPQALERPAAVTAQTKADYSWLTQELLSRLERSKRYPYTARMNRWEGKVVVKAVVRDDGQVVSLQIAESSGHAVLDNDAMELIRQVSPIQLKHPLGKAQVALLVPVGYSLH